MDEQCQKFKSKMDTLLQSCANQHIASKDIYTEKHSKQETPPCDYTIRKLLKCYVCKSAFSDEEQLTRHVCTKETETNTRFICNCCGKTVERNLTINRNTLKQSIEVVMKLQGKLMWNI